ncbi:iron uptake transporter deferrochelatase/peroxidase subunit [Nigerium massiliense]|uniref:iron uptake transporter deferrochelatase/peroxidase subunit n=1 Tax=Nigerium massiliense TaxID=1522317 RepID=UPI0009E5AC4D|nr:iron uptake transporter deferrochelatase/peroxidase subunit [Nigerium massiliense]
MNPHQTDHSGGGDTHQVRTSDEQDAASRQRRGISRRGVLAGSGIAALGLGAGAVGGYSLGGNRATTAADVMALSYPFRGEHQQGILTPQQQQMHTAAFDLVTDSRDDLIALLTEWTTAAENLTQGALVGQPRANREVPPDDTGETTDMGPAGLSITFGFGASLFETPSGKDRYGLASKRPANLLHAVPRMAGEKLDPSTCNGDLIVQACAEDPMVAMHAIHNLTRIAFGRASVRWGQLGYGRTSSTSKGQKTARNLFGFKDGTASLKGEDSQQLLTDNLWIQPGDPAGKYFAGGAYMGVRKISMFMEVWDELSLAEQERIVGRDKLEGAPLSGQREHDAPDFAAKDGDGRLAIDAGSHLAVVHPSHNGGARMLRRGYNFMEGNDPLGRLRGGLFFIAFGRDPHRNFISILSKMVGDAMTEYLQHTGSGLFICPPGLKPGEGFVGEAIF